MLRWDVALIFWVVYALGILYTCMQVTAQQWEYVGTMEEYDENGYVDNKGTEINVESPTK